MPAAAAVLNEEPPVALAVAVVAERSADRGLLAYVRDDELEEKGDEVPEEAEMHGGGRKMGREKGKGVAGKEDDGGVVVVTEGKGRIVGIPVIRTPSALWVSALVVSPPARY